MAKCVLILGKSGSGKSTSMRNFKEDELALVNVLGKPMPFNHGFESELKSDNYEKIVQAIGGTKKKSIVIDDAGYLITNQFMKGHSTSGAGNAIFSFYNDLADRFWALIKLISDDTKIAKDKIVYIIMHEDMNDAGDIKPKTIGKMLDEKVCVEGMFSIVLRAMCEDGRYVFKTKTDGHDVTKTPMGMFETDEIENDLKAVDNTIRKYYNLDNNKEEK